MLNDPRNWLDLSRNERLILSLIRRRGPLPRAALAQAGMAVRPNATETSGLHGAIWRDGRWDGGADPRREGVAVSAAP